MQKPFEARRPEGRERLVALLRQVMIRAAKADIITLPRLEYKVAGTRVCSHLLTSFWPALAGCRALRGAAASARAHCLRVL